MTVSRETRKRRSGKISGPMAELLRRWFDRQDIGSPGIPSLEGAQYATYWALVNRGLIVNNRATEEARAALKRYQAK